MARSCYEPGVSRAVRRAIASSCATSTPKLKSIGDREITRLSPDGYRALATELREALSHREVFEGARPRGRYVQVPGAGRDDASPAHALFSRHLLRAERAGANFEDTITVLHDPEFLASPERHGTASSTFIVLSPSDRTVLIGGTAYAGEIKKAVFSLMNYLLPEHGILPMHAAVNVGVRGDSAVFFGLSGTGKTTLSADPERFLLGDDSTAGATRGSSTSRVAATPRP